MRKYLTTLAGGLFLLFASMPAVLAQSGLISRLLLNNDTAVKKLVATAGIAAN